MMGVTECSLLLFKCLIYEHLTSPVLWYRQWAGPFAGVASDTDGCLLPGQWLQSAGRGHLPADGPRGTYPVCCYGDRRERGIRRQLRARPAHEPQPGPRSCRHQATTHSGNPKVHRWQDQLLQGTDLIDGYSVVTVVWMVLTLFNLYSFSPECGSDPVGPVEWRNPSAPSTQCGALLPAP